MCLSHVSDVLNKSKNELKLHLKTTRGENPAQAFVLCIVFTVPGQHKTTQCVHVHVCVCVISGSMLTSHSVCSTPLALHGFDVLSLLAPLCTWVRDAPMWRRSIFCNRNISDSRAEGIKLKSLCSIVWHVILIISWVSPARVKYCSLNSLAHKETDPFENK